MTGRRLIYLAIAGFCFLFYIAYGQWLSWLVLVAVLAAPWFSLLLSLPAMVRFRAAPSGPNVLRPGEDAELWLMGSCPWPMPPFRGRLRLQRAITGESWFYHEKEDLPTGHCGGITVTAEGVRICDYLGLFAFPVPGKPQKTILIRPRPVKLEITRDLQSCIARSWKPKPGGGYAENHEIRQYRPGDGINQIHWKLTAKTGSLMIREPMEPQRDLVLLTMHLRGTAQQLDRKLGRLLWLGTWLTEQAIPFRLQVLTGDGLLTFRVESEVQLQKAVDDLLCRRAAPEGPLPEPAVSASWHCHIGGDGP